ncbi:unnamed protein product [Lymnaea stagnalis]|uniref:PR domain zinc finger protein 10 n=1 Tax=Lymnaea stagnalis TaxID=6523 RepID=A0AAV2IIF5_LYMST
MAENHHRGKANHTGHNTSLNINPSNTHRISEALTPTSSTALSSANQGEGAVRIPLSLSAENLDNVRANGIQFTNSNLGHNSGINSNGNIVSGSGNFNLSFSNGNVILNNPLDGNVSNGGVILEAVSLAEHQHHQQLLQLQQQNAIRSNGRTVLHSNEISSNGIIDSQNLGNGHLISMGGSDGMAVSDGSNSASGLIQALGAAVSRAVANGHFSNLLSSAMNLPLSINQNGIVSGSEIMTFNTVPTSIMNGASAQLLLNQQQQNHQQLALNHLDNTISSMPSVNLHHGGISMARSDVGGSTVTTSSGLGNSSVTVSLGQQHQQQMWVQPDQSGFLPAAVSLASQGLALQGAITLQGPTSSQDRSSVQVHELQHSHIDGNHYQDLRAQFPGVFQVQHGNRNETYQSAAHSTYGRSTPVQDYKDMGDDSEATPSFSNSQQMSVESQAAVNVASQLIETSAVDSSSLQQCYQLVFDAGNRLMTVQRVMSPSDCTVSQSTLSFDSSEAQASLLPMTSQPGQSYTMVQVSTMPNPFGPGSSTGETKSDMDGVTECDTTQEDIEFHRSPTYLDNSSNIDDEPSLDSTTLHSTIQVNAGTSSEDVIMDSTLDSSDLTALHPVSLDMSQEIAGPSGLVSYSNSRLKPETTIKVSTPSSIIASVRRSKRLEQVRLEPRASQRKMDYKSEPYDLNMLWCEDCMQSYEVMCPIHKMVLVQDKIVMTRAYASLPNQLRIFRIPEAQIEPGDSDHGVQAKRQIPKFTQFGPFVGQLVDSMDQVTRKFFPLVVRYTHGTQCIKLINYFITGLEYPDGSCKYYETGDENKCNWLMFVRPAKSFAEQNLVAYQHKDSIYFSVTRLIESKQELKVWYSAPFAERMGAKTLELTVDDLQALDEEDARFGCFECSRKFKSSAALQQHLSTHDAEDMKDFDHDGDQDTDFLANLEEGMVKGKQRAAAAVRKRLLQGKMKNGGIEAGNYQWKKKSTNLYLSKTLKKYKKRQWSDKTLLGMKSMYKRQGKVSGGSEWMCTHCDLTFDNASLLNLHTLTHAAEDLGMDEIKKLTGDQGAGMAQSESATGDENSSTLASLMNLSSPIVVCPKCSMAFDDHKSLMNHVSMHAQPSSEKRPFDCRNCSKSFSTQENLAKHQMVHGDESEKPLQCAICFKRVMNNAALACHMKTHSEKKYYDCPVCNEEFDLVADLREHALRHMDNQGLYPCNSCTKIFEDFSVLKKHIKSLHPDRIFVCPECEKPFPRLDKLRLHMLRHTSHREFMCETCGRQFKRKDKLNEHRKRVHSKERMEQQLYAMQQQNSKHISKFTPKVLPSEWHRFIYKCHTCLLGFKRRGMLVNHLAKRHPDIKPEQVPELNLPILKTQKDFYCQYCKKIYKSSSKRKSHIQKIHPGCAVPPSSRKKLPQQEASSFSHTVSSVTMMPHGCKFCHKQYASKAKLLQHQRKNHPELVEPVHEKKKAKKAQQDYLHITVTDPAQGIERYEAVPIAVVTQGDSTGDADLLTQAMSELHNYANEFMSNSRLSMTCPPTMVHIQSNNQFQPTTIDINQLNLQAIHSFTSQNGGVATVLAQPQQPTSPTQAVTVLAPSGSQTINLNNSQLITRALANGCFSSSFR